MDFFRNSSIHVSYYTCVILYYYIIRYMVRPSMTSSKIYIIATKYEIGTKDAVLVLYFKQEYETIGLRYYDESKIPIPGSQKFPLLVGLNGKKTRTTVHDPKVSHFFPFLFYYSPKWYLLGICSQSVPLFQRFLLKKVGYFGVMDCIAFIQNTTY